MTPGDFLEACLVTTQGQALDAEEDFLEELAQQVMNRYESQPTPQPLILAPELIDKPDRTKAFYHRLLEDDGRPTADFVTWSSEVLAAWMEETYEGAALVDLNRPHSTDPVWDIITLVTSADGPQRLRLVQVKATSNRLQTNCNDAIAGFASLEEGRYTADLWYRLVLLRDLNRLPQGTAARDLLYDPGKGYRVSVLHSENRDDQMQIMTLYNQRVEGPRERRSARLVQIGDWAHFWSSLAHVVYEHLA